MIDRASGSSGPLDSVTERALTIYTDNAALREPLRGALLTPSIRVNTPFTKGFFRRPPTGVWDPATLPALLMRLQGCNRLPINGTSLRASRDVRQPFCLLRCCRIVGAPGFQNWSEFEWTMNCPLWAIDPSTAQGSFRSGSAAGRLGGPDSRACLAVARPRVTCFPRPWFSPFLRSQRGR